MGTSPNPRWLVKFDGQPYKDEEMYEHAFGRMVTSGDDEDGAVSSSSTGSGSGTQKRGAPLTSSRRKGSKRSTVSSEEEDVAIEDKHNEDIEGIENSQENDDMNAGTESEADGIGMSQEARDRASAREARSKRRQAKIDDDIIPAELLNGGVANTLHLAGALKNKRQRGDEGEVIQVKLLTGTLYLYRGKQRRAEFIRRV